jgi:hypothetical protein
MVKPLLLAYFRSRSTVRGGNFKVTGTVSFGNFDGSIQLGGLLQVAIGLALEQSKLA